MPSLELRHTVHATADLIKHRWVVWPQWVQLLSNWEGYVYVYLSYLTIGHRARTLHAAKSTVHCRSGMLSPPLPRYLNNVGL